MARKSPHLPSNGGGFLILLSRELLNYAFGSFAIKVEATAFIFVGKVVN